MKLRSWYAVHGTIDLSPSPSDMLDSIRPSVTGLTLEFDTVDGTWQKGGFYLAGEPRPTIQMSRVLPGAESFLWDREGWENGLRFAHGENPNYDYVIQCLRETRQTIWLTPVPYTLGQTKMARICEQLCGFLARTTKGVIHVFQEGIFSIDGESLHPYCPKHWLKTK